MTVEMVLTHLQIVLISVVFTIIFGLPLGVLAYLRPGLRKIILWIVDVFQTIPALALLGIIMVLSGPGKLTVIIGLVIYSLLPVVHNTYLGLEGVDQGVKEAARGMGMGQLYRLIHVELPNALPMICTGVRIAVVTSIGVAVFSAFVGGGGLGTILYRGIRIQNMTLILQGTLALVIMSVVFDFAMSKAETILYKRQRVTKSNEG